MEEWDISICRGGASGLLHQTADDALTGHSILIRLDNRAFGKAVTTLHSHTAHLAQARDRNAAGTPDAAGEYDSTARTCWCVIYARADGEGRRADRGKKSLQ